VKSTINPASDPAATPNFGGAATRGSVKINIANTDEFDSSQCRWPKRNAATHLAAASCTAPRKCIASVQAHVTCVAQKKAPDSPPLWLRAGTPCTAAVARRRTIEV